MRQCVPHAGGSAFNAGVSLLYLDRWQKARATVAFEALLSMHRQALGDEAQGRVKKRRQGRTNKKPGGIGRPLG